MEEKTCATYNRKKYPTPDPTLSGSCVPSPSLSSSGGFPPPPGSPKVHPVGDSQSIWTSRPSYEVNCGCEASVEHLSVTENSCCIGSGDVELGYVGP